MKRIALVLLGVSVCFALEASAAVWYVDRYQTGREGNGESWATAYQTIQEGIDAAAASGGGDINPIGLKTAGRRLDGRDLIRTFTDVGHLEKRAEISPLRGCKYRRGFV